jgi:hypothetical protein
MHAEIDANFEELRRRPPQRGGGFFGGPVGVGDGPSSATRGFDEWRFRTWADEAERQGDSGAAQGYRDAAARSSSP